MPAANSMAMKRETLNLRIKPAERDLIDRAAKALLVRKKARHRDVPLWYYPVRLLFAFISITFSFISRVHQVLYGENIVQLGFR